MFGETLASLLAWEPALDARSFSAGVVCSVFGWETSSKGWERERETAGKQYCDVVQRRGGRQLCCCYDIYQATKGPGRHRKH
eukprot:1160068-Pelagomonas_calceolata.AAC.7